jgi:ribosome maturation factor RimP
VKTNTENIEAELVEANDDFVILSWKAREPKKDGKERDCSKTLEILMEI